MEEEEDKYNRALPIFGGRETGTKAGGQHPVGVAKASTDFKPAYV